VIDRFRVDLLFYGLLCDFTSGLRRRGGGCGDRRRRSWLLGRLLNREIIDDRLEACDLGRVRCGEGASGIAADGAIESGNATLHRSLDGFGLQSAIPGDASLYGGAESRIIRRRRGFFAAAQAECNSESSGERDGARKGKGTDLH
jgi:hypothetical protein